MDDTPKSRRPWLVLVVVAMAALGAWYSLSKKSSVPTSELDLHDGRPELIELGMGVCAQCKRMKPVMEQAARELGDAVNVRILDIRNEANEQIAERYQMRVMPTVLLIDGSGRELWRHEGYIGFSDLHGAIADKLPGAQGK